MMKNRFLVLGLVLGLGLGLGLGVAACKKKPAEKGTGHDHSSHMHKGESNQGESVKPPPDMFEPGKVNPKTGKVDVPAKGTGFKPAIAKALVPDGAWICDMGTVHYARGAQGDGSCPICKMKLKQWKAQAAPKANEHMHAH
jgi:rubrerythrin